jgi:hypothetical protein
MPVRISARSLDPLRNAATVTTGSCKYPALSASFKKFCYRRGGRALPGPLALQWQCSILHPTSQVCRTRPLEPGPAAEST